MKSLSKLVSTNNPDKIVFVGEALVGNEAVDQLTKFDRSLREGTRETSGGRGGKGGERGIEGIVLTKFDTIVRVFQTFTPQTLRLMFPSTLQDDKVGAALSMTYVTGQPILFVGCGQVRSFASVDLSSELLSDTSRFLLPDLHGPSTAQGQPHCTSAAARLNLGIVNLM